MSADPQASGGTDRSAAADLDAVLRSRLDRVADRAEPCMRHARIAWIGAELIEHAAFVIGLVALAVFATVGLRIALSEEPVTLSPTLLIVLTVLAGVWYALVRGALVWFRPIERRAALALADRELKLSDRLATADDFLGRAERTPFEQAAIEDAAEHAERATHASWEGPRSPMGAIRRRTWLFASIALASFLGLVALGRTPAGLERPARRAIAARGEVTEETRREQTRPPRDIRLDPPAAARRESTTPGSGTRDVERVGSEARGETKKVEGRTGAGRSAEASASSGQSQSQGVPSDQGKVDKSDPKVSKPPRTKKKRDPKEVAEPPRKKTPEEASGRTAGLGSGRGSSRNPTATPWSSKDRVENVDDEALDEDEDVDDEAEESESRGGMQPNLRDRKPPVSRDLSPSFGNQPNPNAKDRGGPSAQKKSRGTASLVLGVPIPDQVKGQPNPGRTKITQEQIEPKSEEAPMLTASDRDPRSGPIGPWRSLSLRPWMRDLVKNYFLELRQSEESPR
ncbi:MAG: hypothetical protein KDC38_16155 [Planctomycetes bacterium]|nr:hypothetical protein [Planctomycetota bacterium]